MVNRQWWKCNKGVKLLRVKLPKEPRNRSAGKVSTGWWTDVTGISFVGKPAPVFHFGWKMQDRRYLSVLRLLKNFCKILIKKHEFGGRQQNFIFSIDWKFVWNWTGPMSLNRVQPQCVGAGIQTISCKPLADSDSLGEVQMWLRFEALSSASSYVDTFCILVSCALWKGKRDSLDFGLIMDTMYHFLAKMQGKAAFRIPLRPCSSRTLHLAGA